MSLPDPALGLVISYAYLWHEEAPRGREEGGKDRPWVFVLSATKDQAGTLVTVAPVAHRPPADLAAAVELPMQAKRRLGPDDERARAVVSEVNRFRWPGPDLGPIPGSNPSSFRDGLLPAKLLHRIRQKLIDIASSRGAPVVRRTE